MKTILLLLVPVTLGLCARAADHGGSDGGTNRSAATYAFEDPAELRFFKTKNAGIVSLDSSGPISGSTSLRVDTMGIRNAGFNEVQLCAGEVPLKPDTIYHIRFSYRVLQCEGGMAQFQVASPTLLDWLASRGVEGLKMNPGRTETFDRLVVTDEAPNYLIKLSVQGRLLLLIDDMTFEEAGVSAESLLPPVLVWPRNRVECVPGTVELGIAWDKKPAREYVIELSMTDDFAEPQRLAIRAADHTARDYSKKGVNLSGVLTAFLPEEFGEGVRYWQARADLAGAAWSPASQFTLAKNAAPADRVREIGPANPLMIFPYNRNAKKMAMPDSVAAEVSLIPETTRPNFAYFFHAGWAGDIYDWWPEFLAETRKLKVNQNLVRCKNHGPIRFARELTQTPGFKHFRPGSTERRRTVSRVAGSRQRDRGMPSFSKRHAGANQILPLHVPLRFPRVSWLQ